MTGAGPEGRGPYGPEGGERVTLPATEQLGRKGPAPVLVAVLVAAAFLVGLIRPWDWLAPGPAERATGGTTSASPADQAGTGRGDPSAGGVVVGEGTPAPAPKVEPTCAYPRSWRLATIQDWGGRTARVWSAADAVAAGGPLDPAIPFTTIASTSVTALGWCAPVAGPERPPLAAAGSLFRLDASGAREIAFDRLEPAAPDALGELWVPVPQSVGRRPPWPPGRYVIRLAAPGGSFERYLGIEVVRSDREVEPPPSSSPVPGSSPPGSSPAPVPGSEPAPVPGSSPSPSPPPSPSS
jgi:hypothetical protein